MSNRLPRSVYVRRQLLLLAAGFLVAWIVLQLWPSGSDEDDPTSRATVTALPPSATPTPTPPPGTTAEVTLPAGSKPCDSGDITLVPTVASPQDAQAAVLVDVGILTSASKPCAFTPQGFDPLAIVTHDGKTVWDSSVCDTAIVGTPIQLVPGWATTVRIPWSPQESGDSCTGEEPWLPAGDYTLRVGTLGGEPGRADFTLAEPPPPPEPTPEPVPTDAAAPAPDPSVESTG